MTNRLELNWKLDGFVDEQRYYRSEILIDPENLPAPKAVLAGDTRTYIDPAIEIGKTYYTRVSSAKNGVEKISDALKIYAFNQNLFKINSDFDIDFTDKTGKVWKKYGNSVVSGGVLRLDGSGDYLTIPESGDYHFVNSEDVTIRFKVKLNAFNSSGIATVFSTYKYTTADLNYSIRITTNSILIVMWSAQSPTFSYAIPLGQEVEISFERKNMIWRAYVNGSQIGTSFTQTSNYTKYEVMSYLGSAVGEGYGSGRDLNGTIRNFQIIKGLAVGGGQSITPQL
ncbi:LamG-like jellyroll fold domain-containing protein [Acinetobacter sp. ANC 5378]|uniref:LamG-like jellyroll fold domain-containing protein n=1 Tax=Acinetobacter sp. ANC 5378 TaxID=2731249 RepID=UPI001BE451BA|nr:LamG-like jellyroll fold domain-containing protein [Acinetobacter sp. ANC 5378]